MEKESKLVTLVSAEGDEFRLPIELASRMLVIKNMLEGLAGVAY